MIAHHTDEGRDVLVMLQLDPMHPATIKPAAPVDPDRDGQDLQPVRRRR